MCIAAPGKVIEIEKGKALVKYGDQTRYAMVGDAKVKVGSYVLVQMGIIINVMSKKNATTAEQAWN